MSVLESYKEAWEKRYNEALQEARNHQIESMREGGLQVDDKAALDALLSDPEVAGRMRSKALFTGVVKGFQQSSGLGMMALYALWEAQQEKLYLFMDESATLWDAVKRELEGKDADHNYIKAMCQVIDRGMFDFIHNRELAENWIKVGEKKLTMIEDSDTEWINPLSTKGVIGSFKDNSAAFETIESDEDKEKLIVAIFTQSRANVKLTKAVLKGDDFHIKTKVKKMDDGKVEVTFPGSVVLDAKQFRRLKSKLKGIMEIGS